PFAAAIGVVVYAALNLRRPRNLWAVSLIIVLIAPTYLFCSAQYYRSGFFGLSARGADHVAARFITLADPDRVLATGVEPGLVESVFRPIYTWWNPTAWRRGVVAKGAPDHYFPLTRDSELIAAGAPTLEASVISYMKQKSMTVTPYTVA